MFGRTGGGTSALSFEEAMCTHGGIEEGICGSRSSSSAAAAGELERWTVEDSDSRCAISGMAGDEKNKRASDYRTTQVAKMCRVGLW